MTSWREPDVLVRMESDIHDNDMEPSLSAFQQEYSPISVLGEEEEGSFSTEGRHFAIKRLIGQGSFGSVYHCEVQTSCHKAEVGQSFAVKVINIKRLSILTGHPYNILIPKLLKEAKILKRLDTHPHIIKLRSVCVSTKSQCILMITELMTHGDLFRAVVNRRKPFSEALVSSVSKQLVSALAFCHENRVAHRDVKLENIFVAHLDPVEVKLGDFGSATLLEDMDHTPDKTITKSCTTTERYTPPEVTQAMHASLPYNSFKLDAFSLGVVVYILVCNTFPDISKQECSQAHPNFQALSDATKDFIKSLLCFNPEERMDILEAERHAFVKVSSRTSCISPTVSTPPFVDCELEGLLAVQEFIKDLQLQRGVSCWVVENRECMLMYKWRCEAIVKTFEGTQAKLEDLPGEKWASLRTATVSAMEGAQDVLRLVDGVISDSTHADGTCFEYIFGTMSGVLQEVVDALCEMVSHVLTSLQHPNDTSCTELGLKFLLLVGEQLGRERAFVAGHIDKLQQVSVQLRFLKIQGARRMLVGSKSLRNQYDIVSTSHSILPSLSPHYGTLLNDQEIAELEEAEDHVIEGKKGGTEWWSLITGLINTTHSRFSLGLIDAVNSAVAATGKQMSQGSTRSLMLCETSLENAFVAEDLEPERLVQDQFATHDTGYDPPTLIKETNVKSQPLGDNTSPLIPPVLEPVLFDRGADAWAPAYVFPVESRAEEDPEEEEEEEEKAVVTCLDSWIPSPTPFDFNSWSYNGPGGIPPPPPPHQFAPAAESIVQPVYPQDVAGEGPFPKRLDRHNHEAVTSVGTVGHPHSCSRLGCKFAARRGCKEGAACTRCHLCLWTRAAERGMRAG